MSSASPTRCAFLRLASFTLGAALLTVWLLSMARDARRDAPMGGDDLLLPSGKILRQVSLGQHTTVADYYWLKLAQYAGDQRAIGQHLPQVAALANLVTDLDPDFGYAYEVGAVLETSHGRPLASLRLLEKGMVNVADRWQLPFLAAFNKWHDLGDFDGGARLLERAAELPGRPAYLPLLVSRLYTTAGRFEVGLRYLEAMVRSSPNDETRARFSERHSELLVEMDLERLEQEIGAFWRKRGRFPNGLDELGPPFVSEQTTRDGRPIHFDRATGRVSVPGLVRRLHLAPEALGLKTERP